MTEGKQNLLIGRISIEKITDLEVRSVARSSPKKKLNELLSTAICGNDIGSSCLYVSAITIGVAGKLAPVALLAIGLVLYLFRKVYTEVVSALPLNGGAYNALLNTTTKLRASMAACLTILSYLATAVISASEAIHYAQNLFHFIPIKESVLILLSGFALLAIAGIGESARVALCIFIFHIFSMVFLSVLGVFSLILQPEIFLNNMAAPLPHAWPMALLIGFSAAFLGISGFESSANFVEEQEKGVFPKTLRNMWLLVIIFNPLLALLALGIVPMNEISNHSEDLLAHMGGEISGSWLKTLISIDATLVLSGAVLTAFVGSNGLIRRMTLDGCLPQFLLKRTPWKTDIIAITTFWILCCSIYISTKGKLTSLASVYTISFLSVMILFAFGNMLLKVKRSRLPRSVKSTWYEVGLAFFAAILGLIGNIFFIGKDFIIFFNYFFISMILVSAMLLRSQIMSLLLKIIRDIFQHITVTNSQVQKYILNFIKNTRKRPVIYFSRGDDLKNLNRALLYIQENESSSHIQIVYLDKDNIEISSTFQNNLLFLSKAYPNVHLDLLTVKGVFSPETIQALSRRLNVAVNYMFISCPGDSLPHNIAELGGVRVII